MTTPSLTEKIGLYFSAFDPPWFINYPTGPLPPMYATNYVTTDYGLQNKITEYTHEKLADGGDWSANLTFNASIENADEWLCNGLGRRVVIYNRAGLPIFSGFVNSITITAGILTQTRGALLDIGNRVSVIYTPILFSGGSVINGTTMPTLITEDTASQSRYGIIEKTLSTGAATDDDAYMLRDQFLADYAYPSTATTLSTGSASGATVMLDCAGWVKFLGVYIYEDYNTGFVAASTKVSNVFGAEPNNIFDRDAPGSSNLHHIESNPYLVPENESQNRFAIEIIKGITALGDATDNRWIYGVDSNRQFYYRQIPNVLDYTIYMTDSQQSVIDTWSRNIIYPYDVNPGKWIYVSDVNTTGTTPGNLFTDIHSFFIESVRYTAPNTLILNSGRLTKTDRLLAKITMSGGY